MAADPGRHAAERARVPRSLPAARGPAAVAAAALTLLLLAARLTVGLPYRQPDEAIATAVVAHMRESGRLETNWALPAGMPERFKYPQHNFAGYHVLLAGWDRLARAVSTADPLTRLRIPSCLAFLATVALSALLTHALTRSAAAALFTAACAASSVQLFQDSLYARPEACATLLGVVVVWLLTGPRAAAPSPRRLLLAALLAGYLVSIKVSLVGFAVVVIVALAGLPGTNRRRSGLAVAALALGAAGVVAGMPHATWPDFWNGVTALRNQYASHHWPHGLGPQAGWCSRAGHGLSFVGATVGVPILALGGLGTAAAWSRSRGAAAAFAMAAASILYFAATPVFFERNFSHALPLLFVAAGVGFDAACRRLPPRGLAWRWAACGLAALCLALPLSVWARLRYGVLSREARREHERRMRDVQDVLDRPILDAGFDCRCADALLRWPGDFAVHVNAFGRGHGPQPGAEGSVVSELLAGKPVAGYRVVRIEGPFHGMATCTLHTYFRGDDVFIATLPGRPRAADAVMSIEGFAGRAGSRCGSVGRLDQWVEDGQHPHVRLQDPRDVAYGSWHGADSHTGAIDFDLGSCRTFGIRRAVGPAPGRQGLRVTWLEDGNPRELAVPPSVATRGTWLSLRFELPATAGQVHVVAEDRGDGPGEWSAVTAPVCCGAPAVAGHDDAPGEARSPAAPEETGRDAGG